MPNAPIPISGIVDKSDSTGLIFLLDPVTGFQLFIQRKSNRLH